MVHHGEVHSSAMRCATVGLRPRCVTLSTSTPRDDDLEDRLTEQLAGPLDRNGADAGDLAELVALDRPRTNASTSMRNSARKLGFGLDVCWRPA